MARNIQKWPYAVFRYVDGKRRTFTVCSTKSAAERKLAYARKTYGETENSKFEVGLRSVSAKHFLVQPGVMPMWVHGTATFNDETGKYTLVHHESGLSWDLEPERITLLD